MNKTQLLINILNCITETREIMFDITEIPHSMDVLDKSFFSEDMKKIKASHQYMKGNIPDKLYQQIKKALQKYMIVLLDCHEELISIDKQKIKDKETCLIYSYLLNYFTKKQAQNQKADYFESRQNVIE